MPSVVGVTAIEGGRPRLVFGQAAVELSNACYVDEGFSIFYDMKRWISDYQKEEEITDREGRRTFLPRKEILRAYFENIIALTEDKFKCRVAQIHVSCPVKQKFLFQKMFQEILPGYVIPGDEMIDEGVAVLYNTISNMLEAGNIDESREYHALIIDCGGGTTDLCACRFRIRDDRVAYHISIDTAYENGDTDFGGNNLTFRIMQYIKILMAEKMGFSAAHSTEDILRQMDIDIFRHVDANGTKQLYASFEHLYEAAEKWIPTRFKEYEAKSRESYFKVKNNFYLLFFLAEQVKKRFYENAGVLRVGITSEGKKDTDVIWVRADKWKLSLPGAEGLKVTREFPELVLNLYELELILKGDIYSIIRKFMEPLYQEDKIRDFSFIKLTGQSCKIDTFRGALKEFIPGKMIQICRFKLREGARLRINYKDFFDIQTEYDTVNLADAAWAARDGNTLSKYITDYFAEKVLECDRAQEGDVAFARMLLQSRDAVPGMVLDDYIGRKTGNRNRKGPFRGRESFHRLEDILEGIRNGTGSRGSGKRADNERMIILD